MDALTALQTVLDQIDYTSGACEPRDMIAAILPRNLLEMAKEAARSIPDGYELVWIEEREMLPDGSISASHGEHKLLPRVS